MTTESHCQSLENSDSTTYVPPALSPQLPSPEPCERIGFRKAVFVFGVRPRRYGPHLAAGSFRRALAAHASSVAMAFVVLMLALLWDEINHPSSLAELRLEFAAFVLWAAEYTANIMERITDEKWSWSEALRPIWFVLLAAALAPIPIGTLLMPYAAGGDQARSTWKRSVKNAYWSTTALLPATVGLALLFLSAEWVGYRSFSWYMPYEPRGTMGLILTFVGAILVVVSATLWLKALFIGAHCCVGLTDGPAFSPRPARCDDCGYLLTGLPFKTNCPECGLPVRESLAGGRRRPLTWEENRLGGRGFVELIRMQWAVLRSNAVFRRIPVRGDVAAARHFWVGTWIIIVACLLALLRTAAACLPEDEALRLAMGPISVAVVVLPFVLQTVMMFVACLWADARYGIRDYRISAIVCFYGAPFMWPLLLAILATAILAYEPSTWNLGVHPSIVTGLAGLLTVAAIAFWWVRLNRALRSVRFANV